MNQSSARRDQFLEKREVMQMANVLQWIGLAFGTGVIAFGVIGFFRGFSPPPNSREHCAHGKGDYWRI